MNQVLQKLAIIPSIYKGNFIDIDQEINRAYQTYPFPWPHEKQYEHYSKEDALKALDFFERALKEFIERFNLDFDFFKGKVVVDLGAGVGWDALCLARHGAKFVYAVDNSPTSLDHGKRFAQLLGIKNVKFCRHSLYKLDGMEVEADVIIAKGVLHHVFDLSRFVKALNHITKSGTQLLLTHSSYSSVPGFIRYFKNHLAWTIGGADLEKRIDVGVKLFYGTHWQLTDRLVRHRVNDLAGVFYMARNPGQIMKIFRREGFVVSKVSGRNFMSMYPGLSEHHQRMFEIERNKAHRKFRRLMAIGLIETFHFLSIHFRFMDGWLGHAYKFFFLNPPHFFVVQKMPQSRTFKPGNP